ncbi:MAG: hypothetical protein ACOYMS_07230 [Terrimicrobiaceae bacterium]
MKPFLICGLSIAALSIPAQAANEVIEITGATAFRSAATATINAIYQSSNGNAGFISIHNGGMLSGGRQAWRGSFGSLGANVTIRTSWNGSTEGLRAVAQPSQTIDGLATNPTFLNTSILNGLSPVVGGNQLGVNTSGNTSSAVAEMAFSDVRKEATPVPGTLDGGAVGVVTFTMIANKTWRDDVRTAAITNVTSQQFRTLMDQGRVPLSFFTGNESDLEYVYASGRNDGSGTRTTYLAETGYGASTPVKQYVGYDRSNSTVLPSILFVPQDGGFLANGTATATNRSTVWNQNIDGNGGYVSGGDLRVDFAKTTANTTVFQLVDNGDGNRTFAEIEELYPAEKLFLLSVVATADAAVARGDTNLGAANAAILGYEGVRLDDLANTGNATLTATDKAKVTSGRYTMWSNQQLLHVQGNTSVATAFTDISGNISANIGSAGIAAPEMIANRVEDGGIINK